jgi:hypothetical protein
MNDSRQEHEDQSAYDKRCDQTLASPFAVNTSGFPCSGRWMKGGDHASPQACMFAFMRKSTT